MTLAQSGRWVPVQLPDGSLRHDWMPAPQPPSPDGGPGSWRLVPGDVAGYGTWTWFPAPPLPGQLSARPAPPPPAARASRLPVAVLKGRRLQAIGAAGVGVLLALLVLVVLTRGGGSSAPTGTSMMSESQKRSTLVTAANSYMSALLAGDGARAASFLNPTVCGPQDRKGSAKLASFLARTAPGATAEVTGVQVSGDDGSVSGYRLSGGAPAAVRSAVQQGYTAGGAFSWHLRADRWVFDGEC